MRFVHKYESYKEICFEYESYKEICFGKVVQFKHNKIFEIFDVGGDYKVRLCLIVSKYDGKHDKWFYLNSWASDLHIDEVTEDNKCFYKKMMEDNKDDSVIKFFETSDIELENIVSAIEKDCETYTGVSE